MGLPFAFAHHFAGGRNTPVVFDIYRKAFTPSVVLSEPHSMVAVATAVGADRADARQQLLPSTLQQLRMRLGYRPGRVPTLEEALAHEWTESDNAFLDERIAQQAVGDSQTVLDRIDTLTRVTGADEVILVPQAPTLEQRLATLRALAPPARS
jgi:alkanesulfonate monooxygenase SsuD/methylene tetrahydromethanopterin reductase-like flavin-dependent oxidoreductase (luciferase family)